jgi:hypothetical protein
LLGLGRARLFHHGFKLCALIGGEDPHDGLVEALAVRAALILVGDTLLLRLELLMKLIDTGLLIG